MTVVESLSTADCAERKKEHEFKIGQIKEITGADYNEAWKALKEGSYDSLKAIEILNKKTQEKDAERSIQSVPEQKKEVIDLTDEKDNEDIEKAIALSLQETNSPLVNSISNEQRDLNRALEASFNDSNPKRTRTDFWQTDDNANPYEQKRKENYPVGLRNVGNTCWFSAVVQSLFHIPAFRKTILQFGCSHEDGVEGDPKVVTVKELQKLFAFMIGSRRKCIDPSYVIQCLTDFFKADLNQQDVSEFMIKLIDYLEGCFKQKCQTIENSGNANSGNPVVDMFYGKYTVEGSNAGQPFTKEETFGAYPLQIAKYKDLHQSIEGAMVHNDIEPAELGAGETYSQEHWFTRLPAVLVLELSRFRFNQESQLPEKIHNKIEFEENMYMDRYMQKNSDVIRNLRKEIGELKMEKDNKPHVVTNGNSEAPSRGSPEPMEISDGEGSPTDTETAEAMYEREELKTILYRLHAVLVHEGEANGGHYWAFIYDTVNKIWRKFNDVTVSDVTWEEVHRVSVGGSFNTSAYCLIYTDTMRATELYSVTDCYVAKSLKKLVDEDNEAFDEKLNGWDKKEATKAADQETSNARKVHSNRENSEDSENTTPVASDGNPKPKKNHRLEDSKMLDDITHMVTNAITTYGTKGALKEWCEKKREKYQKRATEDLSCSENYQCDVRLEHQAIYMIRCDAPCHVTEKAIFQTFLPQMGDKTGNENGSNDILRAANVNMNEYPVKEREEYEIWHKHYSNFLKANLAFINGLDYLNNYKYQDSLKYLTFAIKLNKQLPPKGRLNEDLLSRAVGLCLLDISSRRENLLPKHYCRFRSMEAFWRTYKTSFKILQMKDKKINENLLSMFSTGTNTDACKALDLMNELVIPSMNMSDCSKVVEHIREQWLTPCVEYRRGDDVQKRIEEFMQCLFEGNDTNSISDPPLLKCDIDCKTLSGKLTNVLWTVNNSPQFLELSNVK